MKALFWTVLSIVPFVLAFVLTQASANEFPPLQTVSSVELSRYLGEWNQIAFFPTRFQKNCTIDTTANYSLNKDGTIHVRNECSRDNGKRVSIEGKARIVDSETNAKLKVKFFWFAPAGDYWIIDLGVNYDYAVVGTPNRKYLWILSRSKTMGKDLYSTLVESAKRQGFPVEKLQITNKVE